MQSHMFALVGNIFSWVFGNRFWGQEGKLIYSILRYCSMLKIVVWERKKESFQPKSGSTFEGASGVLLHISCIHLCVSFFSSILQTLNVPLLLLMLLLLPGSGRPWLCLLSSWWSFPSQLWDSRTWRICTRRGSLCGHYAPTSLLCGPFSPVTEFISSYIKLSSLCTYNLG